MSNPSDKRKYCRSPLDFILEVFAESIEGTIFEDKAVLEDISGEGAMFLSEKPDMYFTGQLLNLTILLPGTEEMEAHMKAKAIVVRIDLSNVLGKDSKSYAHFIAVKFKAHLNFERIGE